MTKSLSEQVYNVLLGESEIGHLYRRGDVTRFAFSDGYWDDPNRPILGLHFEDNPTGRHRSMRLPPWFSNLLPEGRLREWIAETSNASIEREMELLAQVGHDLPGAVRVEKAEPRNVFEENNNSENLEVPQKGAGKIWSFSLAGVGLKFSMLAKDDRLTVPATGENGDWIVKLPDQRHSNVPSNERAMALLAKAAGINMPETRLVHRDELPLLPENAWPAHEDWAYAIKRFDRGENRELIHIEDFAQVRGFYPNQKYLGSFETVAALAYRGHDLEALQEFARRIILNILIGNGDAHLKNWSLIYFDKRSPTLAPAYDIVSTFIYRPLSEGEENMGLNFGRAKRFSKVNLQVFADLESKLSVQAELKDIVVQTIEKAMRAWPEIEPHLSSMPDISKKIFDNMNTRARQFGWGD